MRAEPPHIAPASSLTRHVLPYVVVLLAATSAAPASANPAPLAGQNACNLVPLIPGGTHPLRKHPTLRAAVDALAAADTPQKAAGALGRFDRALAPLAKDATRAFTRPEADPDTGEARPFAPAAARAFLTRWVFSPTPILRVGEERFEPALEVSAWMTLAACRAGEMERAIAIGRSVSGPEGAPLRAFAALLLLEAGEREGRSGTRSGFVEDAAAMVFSDEDFLGLWVKSELADDPAEKSRWHELASKRIQSPDQEVAWKSQKSRL